MPVACARSCSGYAGLPAQCTAVVSLTSIIPHWDHSTPAPAYMDCWSSTSPQHCNLFQIGACPLQAVPLLHRVLAQCCNSEIWTPCTHGCLACLSTERSSASSFIDAGEQQLEFGGQVHHCFARDIPEALSPHLFMVQGTGLDPNRLLLADTPSTAVLWRNLTLANPVIHALKHDYLGLPDIMGTNGAQNFVPPLALFQVRPGHQCASCQTDRCLTFVLGVLSSIPDSGIDGWHHMVCPNCGALTA